MPNRGVPTPVGMTVPDASGTFRQPRRLSVAVSWPSGSIDRPQRGVLALAVLRHIRIGPVEEFAGGVAAKACSNEVWIRPG